MAVTDGLNKGSKQYEVVTPSGRTMRLMADSEMEARQKVAHTMTRRSNLSYAAAWRAVSPSNGKVKVYEVDNSAWKIGGVKSHIIGAPNDGGKIGRE